VLLCSGPISIRNCMRPQLPEVLTNFRVIPADNTLLITRAKLTKEDPYMWLVGLRKRRVQSSRVLEYPALSRWRKNLLQVDYLCPFKASLEQTTKGKDKIFEKFLSIRAPPCRTPRIVTPLSTDVSKVSPFMKAEDTEIHATCRQHYSVVLTKRSRRRILI
jgi:hypothetical protein